MTSEILRNEECNPNLLKKKGLELLDAGKTNEAVECFSKGLVYAPFDSLMRFWRGRKLIGREEYTQSASDLKLAALENPEDWECWYYLGVACYLGGMYEEAKVAHDRAGSRYGKERHSGGWRRYRAGLCHDLLLLLLRA